MLETTLPVACSAKQFRYYVPLFTVCKDNGLLVSTLVHNLIYCSSNLVLVKNEFEVLFLLLLLFLLLELVKVKKGHHRIMTQL